MSACRLEANGLIAEDGTFCTCGPPLAEKCRVQARDDAREPEYPHRPMFVVDWDGTCVEEVWPGMGDWLPGAVESLRALTRLGKVVVWSLRCHLYEMDDRTPRPRGQAGLEMAAIRRMLGEAGLSDIEVYPPNRGKPPGLFYIDDRAVRFDGNWTETLRFVKGAMLKRELEQDGPFAA